MVCAKLSSTGIKYTYILICLQALGEQIDFLGLW